MGAVSDILFPVSYIHDRKKDINVGLITVRLRKFRVARPLRMRHPQPQRWWQRKRCGIDEMDLTGVDGDVDEG